MKLSVCIPVYNERFWLKPFWERLQSTPIDRCENIDSVELILVDDGSSDGTSAILDTLCSRPFQFHCGRSAKIQLIHLEKNRGKGFAIRHAIQQSTGDVVLIQDADLEYFTSDYPALINPITRNVADAVFGTRFAGHPRRVLGYWHSLMNRCLTLLANMLFNLDMTDMETASKVFRGEMVRAFRLTSARFGIEPEFASRLGRCGARLFEVPVGYSGRSFRQGKKIRPKDGLKALYQIFKFSLWDTEPYEPAAMQRLTTIEKMSYLIYDPLIHKALGPLRIKNENLEILELSGGVGSLTETLLHYGNVVTAENSTYFLDKIRSRFPNHPGFGVKLWDASKDEVPKDWVGRFDCVVAFHLLEQIENDERALDRWRQCLKPDGILLTVVPHHPGLYSSLDKALGHRRRYDLNSLKAKLNRSGYEVSSHCLGNSMGALGWLWQGRIWRRTHFPLRQARFYALLKQIFGPIEKKMEGWAGLHLMALAKPNQINTDSERSAA